MMTARPAAGTERDITVDTPLYRAVFTTRGAALKSFQLKKYQTSLPNSEDLLDKVYRWIGRKTSMPEQPRPVELVHVQEGMPRPLEVTFPDSTINVPETRSIRRRRIPGTDGKRRVPPAHLHPDLSGPAPRRQDLHLHPRNTPWSWRSASTTFRTPR